MDRWIFHVDMDAFFASVEQYRVHPELQGLPVCVGPDPTKGHVRGVVSAVSYEAREYGVRAGTPVSIAYERCPNAVFVSSGFANYLEASEEFMGILSEFSDGGRVRRASIDEAYIETTFKVQEYDSPRHLAEVIQQTIKEETNLPCSIGVAPNITVAKVATGMNKPRGITVVGQDPTVVAQFLAPLHVQKLNGVGRKTASQLEKYGITTLGQIQKMSITELWPIMGRGAPWLFKRARGIDERPLIDNGPRVRKSMSKNRTFMKDVSPDDIDFLHGSLTKMCSRIVERLKKKDMCFKTVTVKIRYSNYETIQRSRSLPTATDDLDVLWKTAVDIFNHKRDPDRKIRLLGVRVSGLVETEDQVLLTEYI